MRPERTECRGCGMEYELDRPGGITMETRAYDWVTLHEASEAVKFSATTIRDWYVSGAIESKSPAGGTRLVRLLQVQEHATGVRREQNRRLMDRLPISGMESSEGPEATQRLAREILDL